MERLQEERVVDADLKTPIGIEDREKVEKKKEMKAAENDAISMTH